ncbi:MAG: hypothetical protein P1U47_12535 [Zhongshania sp.]|uniref:zf-HC2 domain-containing protein n=1 Tax=Zhongshania sp. TaxID=1971902 RepID=UPI002625F21E|nr:zf-HC2 domain-containing protein [Zhongshania sp.]MDF1693199.1 hypothetical protein [Zhongshania sp.]
MLNCQQFTDLASDHLDEQCRGWKRIDIRLHLIICRHCRRFNRHLDRSRRTGATLAKQLWRTDAASSEKIFSNIQQTNKPTGDS